MEDNSFDWAPDWLTAALPEVEDRDAGDPESEADGRDERPLGFV